MENGISKVFKTSVAEVLDFLLILDYDYTISEIARNTKLTRKTVYDVVLQLEKKGLVKQTRVLGKSKMYAINKQSPLYASLKQMQRDVMFAALDKSAEKAVMQVKIKN